MDDLVRRLEHALQQRGDHVHVVPHSACYEILLYLRSELKRIDASKEFFHHQVRRDTPGSLLVREQQVIELLKKWQDVTEVEEEYTHEWSLLSQWEDYYIYICSTCLRIEKTEMENTCASIGCIRG